MAVEVRVKAATVMNSVYLPLLDDTNRYIVIYGGAGSGKSVFQAQKIVRNQCNDPLRNTMVVRKVGRTNRNSTFAEIKKVISRFQVRPFFKINESNMLIQRHGGGSIIFEGLDDVEKLKSVTFENGILTDIWFEEATEGSLDDFEQLDLRLRGLSDIPLQITLTFNPISANSWIKRYFFDRVVDDCTILKTTYKDNQFCDEKYIKKLHLLQETSPVRYQIYTLGEWGVLGNLIYTNYAVEKFDIDFHTHYNGLDWGYNDPAAGVKMGFKDNEIYILDEFYIQEKTNHELMQMATEIWDKEHDVIIADNAEPKSIQEWRKAGWKVRPSVKGKDSVRFGIDWIKSHKIHIHPRCQNFINEIQAYSYRKDRNGKVLEEPEDVDNHLMDAMRYGLERLMKERSVQYFK